MLKSLFNSVKQLSFVDFLKFGDFPTFSDSFEICQISEAGPGYKQFKTIYSVDITILGSGFTVRYHVFRPRTSMAPKITIFRRCQRQNNCDLEKWVNMGLLPPCFSCSPSTNKTISKQFCLGLFGIKELLIFKVISLPENLEI